MSEKESIRLPDGRSLEVFLGGDPAGRVLVAHHGTPSDGTTFADWSDDCTARGLRLVCASRPGYANSSRQPGRTVADAARDTGFVLDRLGAAEFLTLGWSGGGPHALACAALHGARCRGVAVLAGVGPHDMEGVPFLDGMGPENVAEFGAARDGEAALAAWMAEHAASLRNVSGAALAAAMGGIVPQVDRDVLEGAFAAHLAAVTRRALAPGFEGWIDDDLAFVRDWGFPLDAVACPVAVWQGALDLMVPAAHGAWLAGRLAGARFHAVPGHGHISLVTGFRAAILDDLAGGEPRSA